MTVIVMHTDTVLQYPLTIEFEAQEHDVVPVKPVIQDVQADVDEHVSHPIIYDEHAAQDPPPPGTGTYPLMQLQGEGLAPCSCLKIVASQERQSDAALV